MRAFETAAKMTFSNSTTAGRPMNCRFQFSLRSILLLLTALAASLAGIMQVPRVYIFLISCLCALLASLAAYRITRNFRPRISSVFASLSLLFTCFAAWALLYVLSLGPFIALSEFERQITGQHHLGRLAVAYRPAMRLNRWKLFRWYITPWIPPDAVGLNVLYPNRISQNLVGTWRTGGTQVVNLRSDGTGRAYGSLTTSDLIYCEWASDASKFAIYQYASKRSASAWLGCVFMNSPPTDSFQVVESSATHFKLRDNTGRIISLTKSSDNKLESAP
jgi:hypothetical protein